MSKSYHMDAGLCIAIGSAFCGAWFIVLFLVRKAPEIGLVDRPNERSSHTRITPRGGGIGFVTAWAVGCILWRVFADHGFILRSTFYTLIVCAMAISAVSLWDDFRSVGVGIRLFVHVFCAAVCLAAFGFVSKTCMVWEISIGYFGFLITAIWVVGLTNVFNFMDGVDGLAGLQATVAALCWCMAGLTFGMPSVSALSGILAGGCVAFLLHNWSPARIFMGDVGSAFLGFVFGVLPLVAVREWPGDSSSVALARLPIFAILVVWPFVADGTFTFCRRLLKREPVWKPHRSHLYQRMVQGGWPHSSVALYYGLWAVVCSVAGYGYLCGIIGDWAWVSIVSTSLVTWLLTNYLERRKARAY